MKARAFLDHCRQVAHWVNWQKTVDQFMHGDPEIEVTGIGTTWLATNGHLRKAAERGLNFVIAHEGAFYPHYQGTPSGDRQQAENRKLIDELGITLMRCHDTWDRMPEHGIPDAWAAFLGFPTEDRPVESFYKICHVDGMSVDDVAHAIIGKTKSLGQRTCGIIGDPEKRVTRMAVGTGAITRLPEMYELRTDIILATDDGIPTTGAGLWSLDLGIPVLVVNHATAELPGMMAMVDYLKKHFPGIRAEYLGNEFPYPVVTQMDT